MGTAGAPVDKLPGSRGRAADGQSVGADRWLMRVVGPVPEKGENTAFQEFQIIAKP